MLTREFVCEGCGANTLSYIAPSDDLKLCKVCEYHSDIELSVWAGVSTCKPPLTRNMMHGQVGMCHAATRITRR